MENTHPCKLCCKELEEIKFGRDKNNNLHKVCRKCNSRRVEANKRWRNKNAQRMREITKKWMDKNPIKKAAIHMLNGAKKNKSVPCNLTFNFIFKKLQKGICERTGLRFVYSKGKRNLYSPSLDRIVPSQGYVQSNVRVILWAFNMFKNKYSDEQLYPIAKAFVEAHKKEHND